MTDTRTYQINGAEVIITTRLRQHVININITVDLSNLDVDEPDHSDHNLINYFDLTGYKTGTTWWWAKTSRQISCQSSSQARRIIKNALAKIDDAIEQAKIARDARKSEMSLIF